MDTSSQPIIFTEDPQTLREVGITLRQIMKSAEERKQIEAKHHEENKIAISGIIEKIDELRDNYPTRAEFEELKSTDEKLHLDHEARIRRLELWGAIAIGGMYIINIIIGFWLAYRK